MPGQRKRYDATFKAKVAIEAIKGQRTVNEIASAHQIHPHQVTQMEKAPDVGAAVSDLLDLRSQ